MNPHQHNKIDINSLSPDEQRLLRLYGKIPNKKDLLQNKLKVRSLFLIFDLAPQPPKGSSQTSRTPLILILSAQERKYFDSGDYALSKAGKASDVGVTSIGSRHPVPENIPHLTATSPPQSSSIPGHFNGHSPTHTGGIHNGFGMSRSPIRESSFPHRKSSLGDSGSERKQTETPEGSAAVEGEHKPESQEEGVNPPRPQGSLPIRR
ncbi:hypothetical protein PRK78_001086 [Emydomyces testavorans]|uniref:mRNA stability protein n=1 Tax=Emydomyces testavorans TaxID=2070801 RepID=A0AAF0DCA7_9EURO|nr:hypothetical protein PRK78_001086 [Emydomyces testavorans]